MKKTFISSLVLSSLMALSGCSSATIFDHKKPDNPFNEEQWYRDVRFGDWTKMGLSEHQILNVLAKIDDGEGLRDDTNLEQGGYWTFEFSQAAGKVLAKAQQNSSPALYQQASSLYLVAAYPNLRRPHEIYAMDKALTYYVKAHQMQGHNVETVNMPLQDGASIKGVMHMPTSGAVANIPAIIWSGGVDKTLVEHYSSFDDLLAQGYAVLTLDMVGGGTDTKHSLKADRTVNGNLVQASTEATSYQAAYNYLQSRPEINGEEVGILTSSGSGVALFEFVLKGEHNLKAVVARCTLVDGPLTQHEMVPELPKMSVDAMIARMGGDPGDVNYFYQNAEALSLATKGYYSTYAKSLELPILGINANGDPIATEEDLGNVVAFSTHPDSRVVITDEFGHCPELPVAEKIINAFLTKNVGR
ncbi:alpha/beta hydrolase [Photobacterium alginatilyticum]|uniref:alpha/beta hydrolase n=1 Tax=Photobacterium alginatilyticum TaxID=1775171 RepID=UPI0040689AEA